MVIHDSYDEIVRCNRCGFCQVACPVFRATGRESGVARGRISLLRAIVEGRMEWNEELEGALFACLLCGACTANCFPGVPTAELVIAARRDYLERVGRKSSHKLLFSHLLPYPERLRLAAKTVALGHRSGLSRVAQALGLLRIFGGDFPRGLDIVKDFPARFLREQIVPGRLQGRGRELTVAYFAGCGMDIMAPGAAASSIELLREIAESVHVLPNACCGLPAKSYGDSEACRSLARRNLEILSSIEFDILVTDCSSCASFLKRYPDLFDPSEPLSTMARYASTHTRDLVEVAGEAILSHSEGARPLRVTYHDPCHASRGQGLRQKPRDFLRSVPGLEYCELPEADWCCGGPGTYAITNYELSRCVLERKVRNIQRTGAEAVLTSCPACIVQLRYGLRLFGVDAKVLHISQAACEESCISA
jgi:glycolate oxidase iron-sulfur subunit